MVKMLAVAVVVLCCGMGWAQTPASGDLNHVLTQLDAAAAKFHSAKADFQWDQFERVVSSTDTQAGVIYYEGSRTLSACGDLTSSPLMDSPRKKTVVYSDGVAEAFSAAD